MFLVLSLFIKMLQVKLKTLGTCLCTGIGGARAVFLRQLSKKKQKQIYSASKQFFVVV